jgi:hypothetical protein
MNWFQRRWRLFNHFCYLIIIGDAMDFSMDDKMLRDVFIETAPHEPSCALRMQQRGWPGPQIMQILGFRGTQLMKALETGLEDQNAAHRRGQVIHDASL